VKLDTELHSIPIGKAEIIRRGEDVAMLAIGAMVAPALEAAQKLASSGIEATVVNARFAKPLDSELIVDLASRIKRVVTVEENTLSGGFGSSVVDLLQRAGVSNIQIKSIGLPDEFIEQGEQTILRSKYGLDTKMIAEQVLSLFPALAPNSLIKVKDEAKATLL
jgi:1-deoxy-D-xylulose-5-phosphate synthase